ncbi:Per1 domain-containing protein, partial [Cephalotus follicularis]
FRGCVEQCEKTGCVRERCSPHCKISSDGVSIDGPWYMQEPLYLRWKQWDCQSDCRYYCMIDREKDREALGIGPVKYHGKWPFQRVYGIQEPVSVVFSVLNLAMHFHGWLSFFILLYYKLPLKQDKKAYYDYANLWHIYGLLAINSWFWSAVFHSRDMDWTEKLDYSSAVALLGFSLIVAILRSFSVRDEATRVMASAPLLAFVATHILFLNIYKLDYGWNMQVCVIMAVAQLLIWAVWAGVTCHPSRWKLWVVVLGGGLAMLLEIYDFPPYKGFVDAHALWHATTIPLTGIWWSFIRDDAEFRTSNFLKKAK